MNPTRRPARNQVLPPEEIDRLQALDSPVSLPQLYARLLALFNHSWTTRAMGEALNPPRAATTIHSWVMKARELDLQDTQGPVPLPAPPASPRATPKVLKSPSPGISPDDLATIHTLAPLARKYRATMHPDHPHAKANRELTTITQYLFHNHVTTAELAEAAGVTYRAMARRLGR